MRGRPLFLTLNCPLRLYATFSWLTGSKLITSPLSITRRYASDITVPDLHSIEPQSPPGSSGEAHLKRNRTWPWTAKEIAILTQGLADGLKSPAITQKLPSRSYRAVKEKVTELKRKLGLGSRWTAHDLAILSQGCADDLTHEEIAQKLPGRDPRDIGGILDLFQTSLWTANEIATLTQGYAEGLAPGEIAKQLPGRTLQAVRLQASKRKIASQPFWAANEIAILTQGYAGGLKPGEIAKQLPRRTLGAVFFTASLRKIASPHPRWTAQEEEILTQGYACGLTWKELAQKLPLRTVESIRQKKIRMGLT